MNFVTAEPTFRHTPDDLMTGHDRVDGRHELVPLVADGMEIGVADAAEKDVDLHVVFFRSRRGMIVPASGEVAAAAA